MNQSLQHTVTNTKRGDVQGQWGHRSNTPALAPRTQNSAGFCATSNRDGWNTIPDSSCWFYLHLHPLHRVVPGCSKLMFYQVGRLAWVWDYLFTIDSRKSLGSTFVAWPEVTYPSPTWSGTMWSFDLHHGLNLGDWRWWQLCTANHIGWCWFRNVSQRKIGVLVFNRVIDVHYQL